MPEQPLAEVFGYPIDNFSLEAQNYRTIVASHSHSSNHVIEYE
jgi:hypothetical protein